MSTSSIEVAHVAVGAGEASRIRTDTMTVKVGGAQTGGAYAMIELSVAPQGGPPFLHKHPAHETFYVIEGEFVFTTIREGGVQTIRATADEVVHVPGGVPHSYKNAGTTWGRALVTLAPAEMEEFFKEMSAALIAAPSGGPPDMKRLRAITEKYGIEEVTLPEGGERRGEQR